MNEKKFRHCFARRIVNEYCAALFRLRKWAKTMYCIVSRDETSVNNIPHCFGGVCNFPKYEISTLATRIARPLNTQWAELLFQPNIQMPAQNVICDFPRAPSPLQSPTQPVSLPRSCVLAIVRPLVVESAIALIMRHHRFRKKTHRCRKALQHIRGNAGPTWNVDWD